MWRDVLDNAQLQALAVDVSSQHLPAQRALGAGVQNLSPYTMLLLADTGIVLLVVPPWSQHTTALRTGCSYVVVASDLAGSPSAPPAALQEYRVRVLLTEERLPESVASYSTQGW